MPRPPPPKLALRISGKPIRRRDLLQRGPGRDRLVGARDGGHAGLQRDALGGQLVAERGEHLGRRADEQNAGVAAGPREVRVLGEESVAGMDGIHADLLRQRDQARDVEVRRDRPLALADLIGLVGLEAVQGETVLVAVDRHGADAQLIRRTKDADRNLAAIRHQQFLDRFHGRPPPLQGRHHG
jgi:hypothetical protein